MKTASSLRAVAVLLWIALIAAPAAAAEWGLATLMAELAAQGPRESNFVEEKYLSLLEHPLTQTGILRYESASSFEKEVRQPQQERYSVDGDVLTVVRGQSAPKHIQLSEHPPLQAFIASLRDTLAGNQAALEQHYRLHLSGTASDWALQLTPRSRALSNYIREILISGSDGRIATFELSETSGDRTVLRILENRG